MPMITSALFIVKKRFSLMPMVASALFIVRKLFQSYASDSISLVHCQKAVSVLCQSLHQPCSLSESCFSLMPVIASALFVVRNIFQPYASKIISLVYCPKHMLQSYTSAATVPHFHCQKCLFQSYASDIVSLVHCHK